MVAHRVRSSCWRLPRAAQRADERGSAQGPCRRIQVAWSRRIDHVSAQSRRAGPPDALPATCASMPIADPAIRRRRRGWTPAPAGRDGSMRRHARATSPSASRPTLSGRRRPGPACASQLAESVQVDDARHRRGGGPVAHPRPKSRWATSPGPTGVVHGSPRQRSPRRARGQRQNGYNELELPWNRTGATPSRPRRAAARSAAADEVSRGGAAAATMHRRPGGLG